MRKEIIIVYEVIVREYDNALLLKLELERRGYKVKILYKTETFLIGKHSAVCVLPNGYSSKDIEFYRYILNANGNELISLQYEQVLSIKSVKEGSHIPKGEARDLWLFCWGNNCKERLLEANINYEKVKVTGAMQLDFFRDGFSSFYYTKEEIAKKYQLDTNRKWILFISSFSYVNNKKLLNDENIVEKQNAKNDSIAYFERISMLSQKEILSWFDKFLTENKDYELIYRPHPVEAESDAIHKLEKKHKHFRCISDLSVKQWILVSEVNTTWFSSSIAEIYAAGKKFHLLRPYKLEPEVDVPYLINADCVDNYEKFCRQIKREDYAQDSFCAYLKDYYSITDIPAYMRVADEIEMIAKHSIIQPQRGYRLKRIQFMIRDAFIFKLIFKKVYQRLHYYFGFKIKSKKLREKYYINDWENSIFHQKNAVNKEKEIKLRRIVNGE